MEIAPQLGIQLFVSVLFVPVNKCQEKNGETEKDRKEFHFFSE